LRIVYRSHGGENAKSRPTFYSKLLALASAVRAVRESGSTPQMIYVNDGPIPGDRLDLMHATGDVVQIDVGNNRASYRAAVQMAARRPWPPGDIVWFAEDDYLYHPQAFRMVIKAAAAVQDADYLSVFGRRALDPGSPRTATAWMPRRGAADAPNPIVVGDATWFRGVATTSTFGVRMRVLRQDRRLLRLIPYCGGAWDDATCLAVQGRRPFGWGDVREDLLPFGSRPAAQWPASIVRGLVRSGVNLRSRRAERNCRRLYFSDPLRALHLEDGAADGGLDWAGLAAQTRAWAIDQGIPVPLGVGRPLSHG
jgi:hypothetical protein